MISIQENISLAEFTTFKIGGQAKLFVVAHDEDEVIEALVYAKKNNLSVFVLGGGSNLLIADTGFHGLVIKIENIDIQNIVTNILSNNEEKL